MAEITSMEELMQETGVTPVSDVDLSTTSSQVYDEELDSPIIGQQYLAKFAPLQDHEDELEERKSSVVSGVHFNTLREMQTYLDDGYEKITVAEQEGLVNGKVRNIATKELCDRPPVVISLESKKTSLLSRVDAYTAKSITGGFEFEVTSGTTTGLAVFDSTEQDQMTFATMYNASQSPNFETTEPYNGFIPMRGRAVTVVDGVKTVAEVKTVYMLNRENMQYFSDALALHIGACKQRGWALQNQVQGATEETWEAVYNAVLDVIDPNRESEQNM